VPLDATSTLVKPVPRANAIPAPDAVRAALAERVDRVNRNRIRREARWQSSPAIEAGRGPWSRAVMWLAPYATHWDCPGRWKLIQMLVPGYSTITVKRWHRYGRHAPIVALAALRHVIAERVNDAIAILAEIDSEIIRQQAVIARMGGAMIVRQRDGEGSIPRSGRRWNQR